MQVSRVSEEAAPEAARATTVESLPDAVVQAEVLARLLAAKDLAAGVHSLLHGLLHQTTVHTQLLLYEANLGIEMPLPARFIRPRSQPPHFPPSAAACASRHLGGLACDQLWGALAVARLGQRLVGLLEASPAPPEWWAGHSWRQRLASLAGGASFQAQVFNRELGACALGLHASCGMGQLCTTSLCDCFLPCLLADGLPCWDLGQVLLLAGIP